MDPAFWRGRRVLITGHTGFKGSWLCLWLADLGAEVTGVGLPAPSEPSLFELARVGEVVASRAADVRDAAAVEAAVATARPEIVLHLAAQAIVRRSLADPAGTWDTNVLGTVHVLEAVRACDHVRAVVVVTSDKCYRDVDAGRPLREDDALGGKDPYSASKAGQELVAAAHRATLLAERGVAVATARAGNVIGGGDWAPDRLVPDLFRAALAGEPLVVRSPRAVRPWQHVVNPLAGYLELAERLHREGPGRGLDAAWNFGPDPGDELPVERLVERLLEHWPGRLDVRVTPDPDAAKEAPVLRLDSSAARERLGWSPGWDLEQGLARTAAWFAAHAGGEDAREATLSQIRAYARSLRFGG